MSIRSMPSNQNYRDNYDAIFGKSHSPSTLTRLYQRAEYELETDGLVSADTQAAILEAGGDTSFVSP